MDILWAIGEMIEKTPEGVEYQFRRLMAVVVRRVHARTGQSRVEFDVYMEFVRLARLGLVHPTELEEINHLLSRYQTVLYKRPLDYDDVRKSMKRLQIEVEESTLKRVLPEEDVEYRKRPMFV